VRGIIGQYFDAETFSMSDTEQDVLNELNQIPAGKKINVRLNSEGGSVKEGLGIYNAFKERAADITCHITGYALSIASVFPLGAGKVVSPKSAIWMMHKAWSWNQGNADDMRQAADMLDTHDQTLADIYAEATGKPVADILAAMEKDVRDQKRGCGQAAQRACSVSAASASAPQWRERV
jgi:ATP-dependent protease ClpP protease subunit